MGQIMFLESLAASHLILASTQLPNWCRPSTVATVNVQLTYAPIRTDFTKSVDQLKTFQIDTINPYGSNVNTIVGGLTQGLIKFEQQMQTGGVRYGSQSCIWAENVNVVLRLEPVVYVASNFPPGTCRHNSILAHEQKHIKVDQDMAAAYKPVFENTLVNAINQYRVVGPVNRDQERNKQEEFARYLKDTIAGIIKRFEADRNQRQQNVDTRAEYDRVAALCKGEP